MAMTRAQLRQRATIDRYHAGKQRPPTRAQARAWLAPIRKALTEILSGEVDSHRGYAITRIHHADNDFARIDHAANGFVALIERLMPAFDVSPIKRISKKLENGILLEAKEVHACLETLKRCENDLLKFSRADLVDAANTEMVKIEMDRLGIGESS